MKKIKISRLIMGLLFLACAFWGCAGKGSAMEIKDQGMMLQLKQLPAEPGNTVCISYSARLIPDKQLLQGIDKTALWYKMDSCFYVQTDKGKVYSTIVQPVANGVAGTFEYMLSFNINDLENGKWNLIYRDRYLNQKKYSIKLYQNNL